MTDVLRCYTGPWRNGIAPYGEYRYVECWMLFDGSNCLVVKDTTNDCSDNDTADNDLMTK